MNKNILRWLVICILPIVLIGYFQFFPPEASDKISYKINGIILACACVFLMKFVLFALIGAHLKQDKITKKHAIFQFIPLILFAIYIVYYFLK